MNWDDFRYVLAIYRGGSLSAAARNLGVNQTTVTRRLAGLEGQLGAGLFLRSRASLVPTETGEALIHLAERMETNALAIQGVVDETSSQPQGPIRVSSMPWIFNHLIIPALPGLLARYPGISIQAITGMRERSLAKREAELALRFEIQPQRNELAIPVATIPYSVYAPKGVDSTLLPWVGFAEEQLLAEPQKWFENAMGPGDLVAFTANDAESVYIAIRSGLGKGLIPDVLGAADGSLMRLSGKKPEMQRQLRALVHQDMRYVARVNVFIDWVKDLQTSAAS